jgi:Ca2+-binding RTX toxin-like protein
MTPRSRLVALPLAAAILALAAPSAIAGTVDYSSTNVLFYTAAPGEVNRLTLTVEGDRAVYTEENVVIQATPGASGDCDGEGTFVVKCKLDHVAGSPVFSVGAGVGDMDDRATAAFPADSTLSTHFDGGPGADTLDATGARNASIDGGAGADKLTGGREESSLTGGADNDEEIGGPAGSTNFYDQGIAPDTGDLIRGGSGLDILSYEGRINALTVTADGTADDGEAGEGDNVSPSVEAIEGGVADDVLTASPAVDASLSGYAGKDRLIGGPGDDILFGGDGDDTLEGNGGDDEAASGDRRRQTVGGGAIEDAGADSFSGGDGFDTVDYSPRGVPVTVTLNGQADDGAAGEGDNTGADVEEFLGGRVADTLAGDGDDELFVGGAGGDTITPGGGTDDVSAGEGDDSIAAEDSVFDRISCGVGTDTVTADFVDSLSGCENATVAPAPVLPVADKKAPKIAITKLNRKPRFKQFVRKGVRFRLGADEAASFVVDLQGTARKVTLARKFDVTLVTRTLSQSASVRSVKLKPKRALIGKRRKLTLRVKVVAKDAAGNQRVATRTVRVRR